MSLKEMQLRALDEKARWAKAAPPRPTSSSTSSSSASSSSGNKRSTYSVQHISHTKAKPIQSIMYDVLSSLKKEEKPVSADELSISIGYDLTSEAFEQLRINPKIRIHEIGHELLYSFKPLYEVRNKEELHQLVMDNPNGLPLSDLRESYKTVEQDMRKLVEDNMAVLIKQPETKDEVAFPVLTDFRIAVQPQFVEMWKNIKLPDAVDMEKEMNEAGVHSMEQVEVKKIRKKPSAEKAPKKRRLDMRKITNKHMLDTIDLSQDYVPAAKKK